MNWTKKCSIGICAISAVVVLGCATEARVLEEKRQGAGLDVDNENSEMNSWEECDPGDESLAEYATGDTCFWGGSSCGHIGFYDGTLASCGEDRLAVIEFDRRGLTDEGYPDHSGPVLTDCETALGEGHTGQPCAQPFACARASEESCCVEVANCTSFGESEGSYSLYWTEICEPGCETIEPDTTKTPAMDCTQTILVVRNENDTYTYVNDIDRPCVGDFICETFGDNDISGVGVAEDVPAFYQTHGEGLRWCHNGLVLGIY